MWEAAGEPEHTDELPDREDKEGNEKLTWGLFSHCLRYLALASVSFYVSSRWGGLMAEHTHWASYSSMVSSPDLGLSTMGAVSILVE